MLDIQESKTKTNLKEVNTFILFFLFSGKQVFLGHKGLSYGYLSGPGFICGHKNVLQ